MPDVEIVCVGGAKADFDVPVEEFPGPDDRLVVDQFIEAIGGQAITAAVAIARLGVPVAYCGVLGRDTDGERIMNRLEEEGISARWVERRSEVRTSRSFNVVTRRLKTRTIITEPALQPSRSVIESISAAWLHLDDVGFPAFAASDKARSRKSKVSVDGGNAVHALDLKLVDLYAPTIARLTLEHGVGKTAREVMQKAIDGGAKGVVATDGANGSYALADGKFSTAPGFSIDKVVSTLGAGDVFHGAILAARCLGKSWSDALRWGNGAAALSCRAIDGQSMTPTRTELEAFLSTR